jgi:ABC-type sugar transport system ATPase subunit
MTMAHLLEADHISKYYGNIVALNDISAHVDGGEVTCILGDNGAGKSKGIVRRARSEKGIDIRDHEPVS